MNKIVSIVYLSNFSFKVRKSTTTKIKIITYDLKGCI